MYEAETYWLCFDIKVQFSGGHDLYPQKIKVIDQLQYLTEDDFLRKGNVQWIHFY